MRCGNVECCLRLLETILLRLAQVSVNPSPQTKTARRETGTVQGHKMNTALGRCCKSEASYCDEDMDCHYHCPPHWGSGWHVTSTSLQGPPGSLLVVVVTLFRGNQDWTASAAVHTLYCTRPQVSLILASGKNRVGGPVERRSTTLGAEVCVGLVGSRRKQRWAIRVR